MRTAIALTAAAAALALAAAPAADAAKLCVGYSESQCPDGQRFASDNLQLALDAAALNSQADTLLIAADDDAYVGPFEYQSAEKLTIAGAGRGKTILRHDFEEPTLLLSSPASEIRDLTLENVSQETGEESAALESDASVVRVVARATAPSVFAHAITAKGNATIADSQLFATRGDGLAARDGAAKVTVTNTQISAGGIGIDATDQARVDARRVSIVADESAVLAWDAQVEIEASLVRVVGETSGYGLQVAGNGTLDADHVTLVCTGDAPTTALDVRSGLGFIGELTFSNGIVTGFRTRFNRHGSDGRADLTFRYSSYNALSSALSEGGGTLDASTGNTSGTPLFVDPVANGLGDKLDFGLLTGSPQIDAADPSDTAASDMLGLPRGFDGDGVGGPRSDMGAYEFQGPAPAPPAPPAPPGPDADPGPGGGGGGGGPATPPGGGPPPPGGGPAKDRVKPKLSKLKRKRSTLTFRLSERSKVTIRLDRRTRRGKFARQTSLTVSGRAGANTVKLPKRLKPGSLRATLEARDLAGNKGTARSIRFAFS